MRKELENIVEIIGLVKKMLKNHDDRLKLLEDDYISRLKGEK